MDFKELVKIVKYRWLTIAIITATTLLLTAVWTYLQPKVYTADANGVIMSSNSTEESSMGGSVSFDIANNSLANSRIKSYVELGSLRSVAQHAIDELGLDTTPEALISRVSVSNVPDTLFIQVKAQGDTPEQARDLAEVWVDGMINEVNILETGKPNVPGSLYLVAKDSAYLPTSPSSPNLSLNMVIGLFAGLIISLASVVTRHFFDRKIRSVEDVERETSQTVIGTVPFDDSLKHDDRLVITDDSDSNTDKNFAIAEALRALRTNIQFVNVDNPVQSIVMTSPLPGDGKSTIAANLAMSMALDGKPTILIDADLRRPMQSTIFNISSSAGLTDVLAGRARLEEVVHSVSKSGNLLLLTAGSTPPNPSEILGSSRMKQLIRDLKQEAFVVIDAPPVLPVTDAAVLSTEADGAVIVATVGKTTHDVLKRAENIVQKVSGTILGIVLNRVPQKGMGAAYYGYQYKSTYYTPNGKK